MAEKTFEKIMRQQNECNYDTQSTYTRGPCQNILRPRKRENQRYHSKSLFTEFSKLTE